MKLLSILRKGLFGPYERARLYELLHNEFAMDRNIKMAFENVGQILEMTGEASDRSRARACYNIAEAFDYPADAPEGFLAVASEYLPANEVTLLQLGHEFDLATLVQQLSNQAELIEKARRGKRANVYQPLATVAAVIAMLIGGAKLLEMMGVPREEWPFAATSAHAVGSFLYDQGVLLTCLAIGLYVVVMWMKKNYVGKLRPWLDKYPPFNLYRFEIGAQFLFLLVLLANNNKQFNSKWAERYQVGASRYVQDRVERVAALIGANTAAEAFVKTGTGFPDPEFLPLLISLETAQVTRREGEMHPLEVRLRRWIDRMDERVQRAMASVRRLALAAVGLGMIWLILAVGGLAQQTNFG